MIKLDYIVMDLEFNQHFDFEDGTGSAAVPECPFEIIQVGFVKLDADFKIKETIELNIRPSIYKRIHPFVGKITGITYRDLYRDAMSFPQCFGKICRFIGSSDNVFAVWGGSDVKLLLRNVIYHGLSTSAIPKNYIDVQSLASQRLNTSSGMSVGLKNAVAAFGIEQERPFHSALNDALYTARIFGIVRKGEPNLEKYVKGVSAEAGELSPRKRKVKDSGYDIAALYHEAEKLFGRKLSASQKTVVRKIYEMGIAEKFKLVYHESKNNGR